MSKIYILDLNPCNKWGYFKTNDDWCGGFSSKRQVEIAIDYFYFGVPKNQRPKPCQNPANDAADGEE